MTLAAADVPATEHALWQAATRFDRATMDRLFAPDFIEFGRNGTFYTRAALLAAPNAATNVEAILHDIAVRPLSDTIALVTYVSAVRYSTETEWSNRSSLWDCASGAWKIQFDQGTPCKAIP